jgi:hypothetical protein
VLCAVCRVLYVEDDANGRLMVCRENHTSRRVTVDDEEKFFDRLHEQKNTAISRMSFAGGGSGTVSGAVARFSVLC